eukprot:gene20474-31523_t
MEDDAIYERLLTVQDKEELDNVVSELLSSPEPRVARCYMRLADVLDCCSCQLTPGAAYPLLPLLVASVSSSVRLWAREMMEVHPASTAHLAAALGRVREAMQDTTEDPLQTTLFPSPGSDDDEILDQVPLSHDPAVQWYAVYHYNEAASADTENPLAAPTGQLIADTLRNRRYLESPDHPREAVEEAKRWFARICVVTNPAPAENFEGVVDMVLPDNVDVLSEYVALNSDCATTRVVEMLLDCATELPQVLPLSSLAAEPSFLGRLVSARIWNEAQLTACLLSGVGSEHAVAGAAMGVKNVVNALLTWADLLAQAYTLARQGHDLTKPEHGFPPPGAAVEFPEILGLLRALGGAWPRLPEATRRGVAESALPLAAVVDSDAIERFLLFTRLEERLPREFSSKPLQLLKALTTAIDALATQAVTAFPESPVLRTAYLLAPHHASAHQAVLRSGDAGSAATLPRKLAVLHTGGLPMPTRGSTAGLESQMLVDEAARHPAARRWITAAMHACCPHRPGGAAAAQQEYTGDVRLSIFARIATGVVKGVAFGLAPYLGGFVGDVLASSQRCLNFWRSVGASFEDAMIAAALAPMAASSAWPSSILRCLASAADDDEALAWARVSAVLAERGAFRSHDDQKLFQRVVKRHPTAAIKALRRALPDTPAAARLLAWTDGRSFRHDDVTPPRLSRGAAAAPPATPLVDAATNALAPPSSSKKPEPAAVPPPAAHALAPPYSSKKLEPPAVPPPGEPRFRSARALHAEVALRAGRSLADHAVALAAAPGRREAGERPAADPFGVSFDVEADLARLHRLVGGEADPLPMVRAVDQRRQAAEKTRPAAAAAQPSKPETSRQPAGSNPSPHAIPAAAEMNGGRSSHMRASGGGWQPFSAGASGPGFGRVEPSGNQEQPNHSSGAADFGGIGPGEMNGARSSRAQDAGGGRQPFSAGASGPGFGGAGPSVNQEQPSHSSARAAEFGGIGSREAWSSRSHQPPQTAGGGGLPFSAEASRPGSGGEVMDVDRGQPEDLLRDVEFVGVCTPDRPEEDASQQLPSDYTLALLDQGDSTGDGDDDEPRAASVPPNAAPDAVEEEAGGDFMEIAARALPPAPRMPRLTKDQYNMRRVARLAGGSSQVQIEMHGSGAAWAIEARTGPSKPIQIVPAFSALDQPKQFHSSAMAAADRRFAVLQQRQRGDDVKRLRDARLPHFKKALLLAVLEPFRFQQAEAFPELPVAYVSEDQYAKCVFPYIVEESVAQVRQAVEGFRSKGLHDIGVVADVFAADCEMILEFETCSSYFYTESDLVVLRAPVWGKDLVVGKVMRYLRRVNSLILRLSPGRIVPFAEELMQKQVSVEQLTKVAAAFHQNYVINHLATLPLGNNILSAAPRRDADAAVGAFTKTVPVPYLAYLGRNFNSGQRAAIIGSAGIGEGFALIQGPPGTGKTHTIMGLLGLILRRGWAASPKVLIVAPSNTAIDEVTRRLVTTGLRDAQAKRYYPKAVRVGVRGKVHPDLLPLFLEDLVDAQMGARRVERDKADDDYYKARATLQEHEATLDGMDPSIAGLNAVRLQREKVRQTKGQVSAYARIRRATAEAAEDNRKSVKERILLAATVVCSTIGSCKELPAGFNVVIVDEAAQAVEPDILLALRSGARLCVLVGDDQQLPATLISKAAQANHYDRSLFTRLRLGSHKPHLLSTQYRMHPAIRSFPSAEYYNSSLSDHKSLATRASLPISPYFVVDVAAGSSARSAATNSISNRREADVTIALIRHLLRFAPEASLRDVGVISPYKDQVHLIRNLLGQPAGKPVKGADTVEVNTVDGFQGREKRIVLVTTVRGRSADQGIGFTASRERLNVALTRGRDCVGVVCNAAVLCQDPMWRRLIADARARRVFFDASRVESDPSVLSHCVPLTEADLQPAQEGVSFIENACLRAAKQVQLQSGNQPTHGARSPAKRPLSPVPAGNPAVSAERMEQVRRKRMRLAENPRPALALATAAPAAA